MVELLNEVFLFFQPLLPLYESYVLIQNCKLESKLLLGIIDFHYLSPDLVDVVQV